MKGRVLDKKEGKNSREILHKTMNEVLSKCVVFLKKRVKRKIRKNKKIRKIRKTKKSKGRKKKRLQLRNRKENLICGGGGRGTRQWFFKAVFVGTISVQYKL